MTYDFTTYLIRTDMGSNKWNMMRSLNTQINSDIIPFSVADMELKNAPEIISGLKECLEWIVLGYAMPRPSYHKAVCEWMERRHNWHVEPEWLVNTAGVVSAIYSVVTAFTNPGDAIIVQPPVYYQFFNAVIRNNRKIVYNPLIYDKGHYEIDFIDLEQKVRNSKAKLILFCSPHNPVGRVWSPEELHRLSKICINNNVIILSDEIHFDLIMPEYNHTVITTLNEQCSEWAIVCTSPSKTFNLAGMHHSNIVIKNPIMREQFRRELLNKSATSLNILGYYACEIAYTKCEAWLTELILHLDTNRKLLRQFIESRLPAIKVIEMEGSYLQWIDCRGLGLDYLSLQHMMQQKAQLFMDEGHLFGEEGKGFERINLACPTKKLEEALLRLEAAAMCL